MALLQLVVPLGECEDEGGEDEYLVLKEGTVINGVVYFCLTHTQ